MDFATSSDPAVQAQLDRLVVLRPGADILGLERITALLARVGNPHRALPPVFHVAGTNGKGSTCAFLRAALEGDGKRVHVFTSPHLVRFNERIRLAGRLIEDGALAEYLGRVLDAGEGVGASFFEVSTAAAFLAFSEVPADACVIEVGLGGRLDATNVIVDPAACGIAQLGIDHQAFLGDSPEGIAREKAGIAKPGRPLVTQAYSSSIAAAVADAAGQSVPIFAQDERWHYDVADHLFYRDRFGTVEAWRPTLPGTHQFDNYALAMAMLRHQDRVPVTIGALQNAARGAVWPARMQRMGDGPLRRLLPEGAELWLDGGHNAGAARAIADTASAAAAGRPIHFVVGMLANKDLPGFLAPLLPIAASLTGVPIANHEHHPPSEIALLADLLDVPITGTARTLPRALGTVAANWTGEGIVLILGSLYLAGEALALNDEPPT